MSYLGQFAECVLPADLTFDQFEILMVLVCGGVQVDVMVNDHSQHPAELVTCEREWQKALKEGKDGRMSLVLAVAIAHTQQVKALKKSEESQNLDLYL
jgi:hypothetical protein